MITLPLTLHWNVEFVQILVCAFIFCIDLWHMVLGYAVVAGMYNGTNVMKFMNTVWNVFSLLTRSVLCSPLICSNVCMYCAIVTRIVVQVPFVPHFYVCGIGDKLLCIMSVRPMYSGVHCRSACLLRTLRLAARLLPAQLFPSVEFWMSSCLLWDAIYSLVLVMP